MSSVPSNYSTSQPTTEGADSTDRNESQPTAEGGDVTDRVSAQSLWSAAHYGRVDELRALLDTAQVDVEAPVNGQTPLRAACNNCHIEAVDLLLSRGANVDAASGTGSTPLMEAAFSGKSSLVRLLLVHGADTSQVKRSGPRAGLTAAEIAASQGHIECVSLIHSAVRRRSGLPNAELEAALCRLREIMAAESPPPCDLCSALGSVGAHSLSTSHLCEADGQLVAEAEARFAQLRHDTAIAELRRTLPACHTGEAMIQAVETARAAGAYRDTPIVVESLRRAAVMQRREASEALAAAMQLEDAEALHAALDVAQECKVRGLQPAVRKLAEMQAKQLRLQRVRLRVVAASGVVIQSGMGGASAADLEALCEALALAAQVGLSADDETVSAARRAMQEALQQQLSSSTDVASLEAALQQATRLAPAARLAPRALESARSRLVAMQVDEERAAESRARRAALGLPPLVPIPMDFCCPITQEKMCDPVVASDGHSYERAAIAHLLAQSAEHFSPLTRAPITSALVPNINLRNRIREYEVEVTALVEEAVRHTRRSLGIEARAPIAALELTCTVAEARSASRGMSRPARLKAPKRAADAEPPDPAAGRSKRRRS